MASSSFCLRSEAQIDGELIGAHCFGSRPPLVLLSCSNSSIELLNALQGTLQESWVLHTQSDTALTQQCHLLQVSTSEEAELAAPVIDGGLLFVLRGSSELLVWQRRNSVMDSMPSWNLGGTVAHLSSSLKRLSSVMQAVCIYMDTSIQVLNVKDRQIVASLNLTKDNDTGGGAEYVWSKVMLIRTLPAILMIVKVNGAYALRVVRMNWQVGEKHQFSL